MELVKVVTLRTHSSIDTLLREWALIYSEFCVWIVAVLVLQQSLF